MNHVGVPPGSKDHQEDQDGDRTSLPPLRLMLSMAKLSEDDNKPASVVLDDSIFQSMGDRNSKAESSKNGGSMAREGKEAAPDDADSAPASEVAPLIDEDSVHDGHDGGSAAQDNDEAAESNSQMTDEVSELGGSKSSTRPRMRSHDRSNSLSGSVTGSAVLRAAQLASAAKEESVARRLSEAKGPTSAKGGLRKVPNLSLDEDVANVDRLLIRVGSYVILCWITLVLFSYWAVPAGCIVWYEGAERNAALVELSILTTAVIMKHFPILLEMKFSDTASAGVGKRGRMPGRTKLSGILVGGLVTQFIAVMTTVIMVVFPVPVMVDPILGSRVHFIRWCEWVPLAGYMTLMTESVDAPEYDGEKLTHQWKTKFNVAILQSLSTLCGVAFPFCTNYNLWMAVMIFSCVTYSAIIVRYFQKARLFKSCVWKGGGSVDEIELYERARMSLALHSMCTVIWTLITLNYFVTSMGHLFVSESWESLHDPAVTMIGECFMDLLAKCLYMALILEAHSAAFDEAKRANRRLAELRNTMSVVWESSSDTIAISVQKVSGNITSMVSPSFFRSALVGRQRREKIDDISAIILEHSRDSITNVALTKDEVSDVGIKVVRKADFASVDLHSAGISTEAPLEFMLGNKNDAMTSLVVAFTDMLSRAWQSKSEELLFEHDTVSDDGSVGTKFEVKATRLEENAVVVVVRNVSERYRRFEAEKRFVFETTARQKDAEANRFTRHEVKNGLLAAIEICGNIRENLSDELCIIQQDAINNVIGSNGSTSERMENVAELDRTLHEVLDIVLAETMARDLIHEMYVPRMERIDVNHILKQTRGFKANERQFSLVCKPSPLPVLLSDQGLFKCIHGNAIRNALKYGEPGGNITTEATYDPDTSEFSMRVINLPGPGHDKLVAMGNRASELVFSHGTRLHKDSDMGNRSHSAGDGAWIIRKCANILGGTCEIFFEEERTVFEFKAPIKLHPTPFSEANTFHLPEGVWGIGIDDSKIQRKLLRRFFLHAGVLEARQIILGQKDEEIAGFVDFVVDFVNGHPGDRFLLIVDENLEMGEDMTSHETVSGSDCIKKIRKILDPEQEKLTLALVRSANDSPQDLALYTSRAHGYMPKVPLRGMSVREMVSPLWEERFPDDIVGDDDSSGSMARIQSIENLRDLTLISPVELLAELERIDTLCVRNRDDMSPSDRWPILWDKLHQLKGDLKSINVDDKCSDTIQLIESLRGDNHPAGFMSTWLQIREDVISFIAQH